MVHMKLTVETQLQTEQWRVGDTTYGLAEMVHMKLTVVTQLQTEQWRLGDTTYGQRQISTSHTVNTN